MRIMIDTVGFKALINYETFEKVKEKTRMTQRIDKETGEIEFEYDNGQTNHSNNYRVLHKISDEYWDYNNGEDSDGREIKRKRQPNKKIGIPHVKLEFSVPKILLDNNLCSASMGLIYDAIYIVKKAFEEKYDCLLPDMPEWYCYRIDTCANYVLSSEQEVRNYISSLSKLDYPRREPIRYGDSGIYFPSQQNTLKVYAKGPEFKKHDMSRFLNVYEAYELYEKAKKILRIEAEHKRRIRYITSQYNKQFENKQLEEISEDRGQEIYLDYLRHEIDRLNEEKLLPGSSPEKLDKEIARIKLKFQRIDDKIMMFEGENALEEMRIKTFEGYPRIKNLISIFDCKSEMEGITRKLLSGTSSKVTQSLAVENRIRESCSRKQASTFIAVYYSIINQGQSYAKQAYERNIYYRALAFFKDNGVSLITNNPDENNSAHLGFPEDFRLDMDESNAYYQTPVLSMEEVLENKRKWMELINAKKLVVNTSEKAFRDYWERKRDTFLK